MGGAQVQERIRLMLSDVGDEAAAGGAHERGTQLFLVHFSMLDIEGSVYVYARTCGRLSNTVDV